MSHLNALLSDLRDRKLWPVAVALLAAVVAVPVLLTKSASPAGAGHGTPSLALPVDLAKTGPAVTVDTTPGQASLNGKTRDPFTQLVKPSSTTSASTASAANSAAAAVTGAVSTATSGATGSTGSTGSAGSGSASTGGTYTSPTPPSTTPSTPSSPKSAALAKDQVYAVGLSLADPSGSLTSPALQVRDSVFPNPQAPLLVYLGVLQGGQRALFAVMPGTVLSGQGSCIPGPVYCQILSLGQGQQESVATAATASTPYQFQVEKIFGATQSSAAAATQARNAVSAPGRTDLDNAALSAVQLFSYDPSIGALVDQRNLTVGGN